MLKALIHYCLAENRITELKLPLLECSQTGFNMVRATRRCYSLESSVKIQEERTRKSALQGLDVHCL